MTSDALADDTSLARATAAPRTRLVACPDCDALQRATVADRARTLRCVRCGAVVQHAMHRDPDDALALSVAAALCFLLGNMFPVVALQATGNTTSATLLGASHALYAQDMRSVALVVLLTTIVVPAIDLCCLCALLAVVRAKRSSPFLGVLLRLRSVLRPWSMVEIFVLGALVAIVKLGDLARIVLGIGMWSLVAFMVVSAAATFAFDRTDFWSGSRMQR